MLWSANEGPNLLLCATILILKVRGSHRSIAEVAKQLT